jgi:hypothetical protein
MFKCVENLEMACFTICVQAIDQHRHLSDDEGN